MSCEKGVTLHYSEWNARVWPWVRFSAYMCAVICARGDEICEDEGWMTVGRGHTWSGEEQ